MKIISIMSITVLLMAVSSAHDNSVGMKTMMMRPSQWISPLQLEQLPSMNEMSLEKLENMSMEKAADMVKKMYHLSQINHNLRPNFVPSPSSVPVQIYRSTGQILTTTLDKMATASAQVPDFGVDELTIFITGLPAMSDTVRKANRKLVEAYIERYNLKKQNSDKSSRSTEKMMRTSSEENSNEWQARGQSTGSLLVIDLGSKLNNFNRMASLDTEQTGAMLGSAIMEMMEKNDIADESVHVLAQGIASHVAGAAGNEYTRRTGSKLRRITALDPWILYSKDPQTVTSLARGDAEFVDAIHTSTDGLGTIQRVGDVDFYPNGPAARNIVEATMRATLYFAESVRPGNERNFPAAGTKSLKKYLNNDGYMRRGVYMGIDTDYDAKGDYILEVNQRDPFGKRSSLLQKKMNKPWKNNLNDE